MLLPHFDGAQVGSVPVIPLNCSHEWVDPVQPQLVAASSTLQKFHPCVVSRVFSPPKTVSADQALR